MKLPFVIYADLECVLKKIHSFQNDPEKPYTIKKDEHIPSGYSLFTQCSFDAKKKRLVVIKVKVV